MRLKRLLTITISVYKKKLTQKDINLAKIDTHEYINKSNLYRTYLRFIAKKRNIRLYFISPFYVLIFNMFTDGLQNNNF